TAAVSMARPDRAPAARSAQRRDKQECAAGSSYSILEAYMRRDDAPPFGKAHPGLHLPALAPGAEAPVLATRGREIATESRDHDPEQLARDVGGIARDTKAGNRFVAVELFARAVTDGP